MQANYFVSCLQSLCWKWFYHFWLSLIKWQGYFHFWWNYTNFERFYCTSSWFGKKKYSRFITLRLHNNHDVICHSEFSKNFPLAITWPLLKCLIYANFIVSLYLNSTLLLFTLKSMSTFCHPEIKEDFSSDVTFEKKLYYIMTGMRIWDYNEKWTTVSKRWFA